MTTCCHRVEATNFALLLRSRSYVYEYYKVHRSYVFLRLQGPCSQHALLTQLCILCMLTLEKTLGHGSQDIQRTPTCTRQLLIQLSPRRGFATTGFRVYSLQNGVKRCVTKEPLRGLIVSQTLSLYTTYTLSIENRQIVISHFMRRARRGVALVVFALMSAATAPRRRRTLLQHISIRSTHMLDRHFRALVRQL